MRVSYVEIRNFRKLHSVRIDFDTTTTLLVGANNSGKTSAMLALHAFLVDPSAFTTSDFTLPKWTAINEIGAGWELPTEADNSKFLTLPEWEHLLPSLDLWLEVGVRELHYVRDLLPTLDWSGGLIGVRLRLEPKDAHSLRKEFLSVRSAVVETKLLGAKAKSKEDFTLSLWPSDLREFLDRRLRTFFAVCTYRLDPSKQAAPVNGVASPQPLPHESEPVESNSLQRLIRIDTISAQRGMAPAASGRSTSDGDGSRPTRRGKLSHQLRDYYDRHLDPSTDPRLEDLEALEAIEVAQKAFDGRLADSFSTALNELATLNYPGITDPQLTLASRLRATDGLSHDAAVQYAVTAEDGTIVSTPMRLPEEFNGLGYQNLISMVFQLMAFRDAWMRVGKMQSAAVTSTDDAPPPLHLVLIEEPEAHLHCQVQQVFVRKAYEVLRNHEDLTAADSAFTTQLVVSTHSSHVAHEIDFTWLRYFRRLPASTECPVPCTAVINLSRVFETLDETKRFVTRYLRTTHADLFFADGAILVEGPAERLLVPHFIRRHFPTLDRCYLSLLEIGGSHAHRLKPLIEHLGLTTLIITDIDAAEPEGRHNAALPQRGQKQITTNATLKSWHPGLSSFDTLLDLPDDQKVRVYPDERFSVRVAYQVPLSVASGDGPPTQVLASTLEDSLVVENLALFRRCEGSGPIKKVRDAIDANPEPAALCATLFEMLPKFDKAAFALDLLWLQDPETLAVPRYIDDGLTWLQDQLTRKRAEVLATVAAEDSVSGAT